MSHHSSHQSDSVNNNDDIAVWTVEDASLHYNLPIWSEDFFDLNDKGEVIVRPNPDKPELTFSLLAICDQLKEKGMTMPALLRFVDILKYRVKSLCEAFNEAREAYEYRGDYTVCYPIKVNQQRRVVEGLLSSNEDMKQRQVGLEAGSKPELMAVLALAEKTNSTIVCNGYKDREYIRAALIAARLGHRVYIVVEKITELDLVLTTAEQMNVEPRIGVRARLASKGESKWQDSGGDHSKFGLSASQILRVVERLKQLGKTDIFQLLHFHLGSQITSIRDIQNALKECARFYAELRLLGMPIATVDVGGGLGVDYEGTRSQSHCSVNYSLAEYANNVVGAFTNIAEQHDLPHPNIITESGRALTAHHAVLLANVIDCERMREHDISLPEDAELEPVIQNLWEAYCEAEQALEKKDDYTNQVLIESYHTAEYCLKQAQEMFNYGMLSLSDRALAERLHKNVVFTLKTNLEPDSLAHVEMLTQLEETLASKYFVNFSIFQSLPDAWAIDQIFPLLPLKGLDQYPDEVAILQDITCDSDGVLEHYVNQQGITSTINLPRYQHGEDYLLGLFMVGAYQEILGDMHNLFGDTNTIDLKLDENGELKIMATEIGSTVEELLDYVDFGARSLLESYKRQLSSSDLPMNQQRQYLAELRQGIYGYSYLEE